MKVKVWDKTGSSIGSAEIGIDSIPKYIVIGIHFFIYDIAYGVYIEVEVYAPDCLYGLSEYNNNDKITT